MGNGVKEKQALAVGYWAAVSLPDGAAPMRSYVGEINAVDDRGIRLTLIDWLSGTAYGFDVFIPWANIQSALVAISADEISMFMPESSRWQACMNRAVVRKESIGCE